MLLKALEEVATAPNPMMAAEMAMIRLTHVADLPSPEELVRRLSECRRTAAGAGPAPPAATDAPPADRPPPRPRPPAPLAQETAPAPAPAPGPLARYARFEDVVALVRARRDVSLLVEIEESLRLVRYAPGRIEFEPADAAPPDLAARLAQRLQLWTGARWGVAVLGSGGGATIAEVRAREQGDLHARSLAHPMVQAVLAAFPGAEIREVRPADALAAAPAPVEAGDEPGTRTTTGIRSIRFQRRAECSRVWDSLATWPRS